MRSLYADMNTNIITKIKHHRQNEHNDIRSTKYILIEIILLKPEKRFQHVNACNFCVNLKTSWLVFPSSTLPFRPLFFPWRMKTTGDCYCVYINEAETSGVKFQSVLQVSQASQLQLFSFDHVLPFFSSNNSIAVVFTILFSVQYMHFLLGLFDDSQDTTINVRASTIANWCVYIGNVIIQKICCLIVSDFLRDFELDPIKMLRTNWYNQLTSAKCKLLEH